MKPSKTFIIAVFIVLGIAAISLMMPALAKFFTASIGGGGDVLPFPGTTGTSGQSLITWDTSVIDSAGAVGFENSLSAPDAKNVFVAYRNVTKADLDFARSTDGGKTWTKSVIDSAGDTGNDPSVFAVDANNVYVTYRDADDETLNFAKSTDGGINWTISVIDGGAANGNSNVGTFSYLYATDASHIFVSYRDIGNQALKFAKSIDAGQTWTAVMVDNTVNVGPTMSLDTPDGNSVFISYRDQTNATLKFATSLDGGEHWTNKTIDTVVGPAGLGVGKYSSVDAISPAVIFISYRDSVNQDLRFAKSTDGGVTWTISVAAGPGDVGTHDSLQAFDAKRIYISYRDVANGDLLFARSGDGGATWKLMPVDATPDNVGISSSLAAPDSSTIFVSYYDSTNFDLKFAQGTVNTVNLPSGR